MWDSREIVCHNNMIGKKEQVGSHATVRVQKKSGNGLKLPEMHFIFVISRPTPVKVNPGNIHQSSSDPGLVRAVDFFFICLCFMLQDLSKPGSLVYLFAEVNILLERGNLNFFKLYF